MAGSNILLLSLSSRQQLRARHFSFPLEVNRIISSLWLVFSNFTTGLGLSIQPGNYAKLEFTIPVERSVRSRRLYSRCLYEGADKE